MAESSGSVRYVRVIFDAVVGRYRAGMATIVADTRRMSLVTASAVQANRRQFDALGAGMAISGALLTKGLIDAAAEARGFEADLTKMRGLVGLTADEVENLGKAALGMGDTGKGPRELADALYYVTSAGISAADAVSVVEASARAAAAGLGDTAQVADAVSSAVNAYGISAMSASHATDILVNTVREGKAEASEVAGAIGRVIPIAAEMGVEFDQVGAAIAVMTRIGNDAEISVTALRGVLAQFLKPTKEAEETLQSFGLSAAEMRRQIAEEGLFQALTNLKNILGDDQDALGRIIPDVRALTGFLAITGKNVDENSEVFDSLAKSLGLTDNAFELWSQTAEASQKRFGAAMQAAKIEAGQSISPIIQLFHELSTDVLGFFSGLPGPVQAVLTLLAGGVGVLLALGGAALLIGPRVAMGIEALKKMGPVLETLKMRFFGAAAGANALRIAMGLITGVAIGAVIFGLQELIQRSREYREEGEKLASQRYPSLFPSPEDKAAAEGRIDDLIGKLRTYQDGKAAAADDPVAFKVEDKGVARTIDDMMRRIKILRDSRDKRDLFDWIIGKDERVAHAQSQFEKTMQLQELMLVATGEQTAAHYSEADAIDRAADARAKLGKQGENLALKNVALDDAQQELLAGYAKEIQMAQDAGVATDHLTMALAALLNFGDPDPLLKLAGVLEEDAKASGLLIEEAAELDDALLKLARTSGIAVEKLAALGDEGVETFENILDAAEEANQTFRDTFGLLAKLDLPPTAKEAAEELTDALDGLRDAEDSLADAQERVQQNQEYIVRTPGRDKELKEAQRDLADAQRDVAKSQDEVTEARKRALTPGEAIEDSYKKQVAAAEQFLKDLVSAAERGVDPEFLARAAADPESFGPILEAIRKDTSGRLVGVINTSERKLKELGVRLEGVTRILGAATEKQLKVLDENILNALRRSLTDPANEVYQLSTKLAYKILAGLTDTLNGEAKGGAVPQAIFGSVPFGPGTSAPTYFPVGPPGVAPIPANKAAADQEKPKQKSGSKDGGLHPDTEPWKNERHGGGLVLPRYHGGGRLDRNAPTSPARPLMRDEMMFIGRVGEYVIDRDTTDKIGDPDQFVRLLKRMHIGGPIGPVVPTSSAVGPLSPYAPPGGMKPGYGDDPPTWPVGPPGIAAIPLQGAESYEEKLKRSVRHKLNTFTDEALVSLVNSLADSTRLKLIPSRAASIQKRLPAGWTLAEDYSVVGPTFYGGAPMAPLLPLFHDGGRVTGRDREVPILAEVGERVVDKHTTAYFGEGYFEWMKQAARMHSGGSVYASAAVSQRTPTAAVPSSTPQVTHHKEINTTIQRAEFRDWDAFKQQTARDEALANLVGD